MVAEMGPSSLDMADLGRLEGVLGFSIIELAEGRRAGGLSLPIPMRLNLGGRSFSPDPCCMEPPPPPYGGKSREDVIEEPGGPPKGLLRLLGWVLFRFAVNRSPKSGRSANLFSKLSRFGLKSLRWSRFSSR